MFFPDFNNFKLMAETGNLIPVYREILADFETPVTAYLKLAATPSFLLESVVGGEKWARYSFIGTGIRKVFSGTGGDPFEEAQAELRRYRPVAVEGLPSFTGGLVGYYGYDTVRSIEKLPDENHPGIGLPDRFLMLADSLVIFDNFAQKIKVVANACTEGVSLDDAYSAACEKIESIIEKLRRQLPVGNNPARNNAANSGHGISGEFTSNFPDKEAFKAIVERSKEYIRAGDIFQVVLSQRFGTPVSCDPFDIYRALRVINPSPYMYYINTGDAILAGSSPEILVRLEGGEIELRPIAGTRRRGKNAVEDRALEAEMKADPKECAEHIMLVDLGRNDVGRVAKPGTVRVTDLMAVERYSHVMHMVSNVTGKLRGGLNAFDVIRASFPAGTLSGAPKVRAMEVIEELEPTRRGTYGGSVGYIGFSGSMDMCITIRTILIKDGMAYVQAGAGIVADSDPEMEYAETVNKAKGMFKAVALAQAGLE